MDKLNSEAMEQSALLAEKQAEADEALRLITTSMTVRVFFSSFKLFCKHFKSISVLIILLLPF